MREIPFGRPMIGPRERQAVMDVLDDPLLVHGPRASAFEEAFAAWTGAPHAVSVSSCTAAMHLFWFAHDLGPGDEVVVSAMTHTATAHAIAVTGATPVFADALPSDGNVDVDAVAAAIGPNTRGIAVVHYNAEPADMARLRELADRHDLLLLEDCALAVGSRIDGVHVGLHGDAGMFSFYPVKHMTTAEGGMFITRDPDLAERIRRTRAFGVDRTVAERSVPGVYDVTQLGFNYRMNEIQAAIGLVQVSRLDDFIATRRANFESLADGLSSISEIRVLPASSGARTSGCYCLVGVLEPHGPDRFKVVEGLRERGVGTSVYYPRPVPLMSWYRERLGHDDGDFPVAERLANHSIALPVGPHLTLGDMDYVSSAFADAIRDVT